MLQTRLKATIRVFSQIGSLLVTLSLTALAEQHAILVGVWDYENPNLQLDAPPNDLKLMKEVLTARGVSTERTHILTNPNKRQMQRKLRELSRKLSLQTAFYSTLAGTGHR